MPDPTMQEINEAVVALRTELKAAVPNKEVIEKANAFLDRQEALNQKMVSEQQLALKNAEEFKNRIDTLEAEIARKSANTVEKTYKDSPEFKALQQYAVKGIHSVDAEVKALLRTDQDNAGGYLTFPEFDTTITKYITEISPIRSIARVRTLTRKELQMPVRKTLLTSTYEGEAAAGSDSTSTYGSETLNAWRQTVTVPITMDQLMDSAFDMESEIFADANEAFAQKEGQMFVTGTGVKQPEGFLSNATLTAAARTSTTSGTVDAADVILLTGDLKVGYNPVYVMNRTTLAILRTKVATDGNFLWQPGLNGPVANTINGFSYILAPNMPDIAANSYSIAFGDFRRGYVITDRTGISMIRDEVTRKREAIVEFTIHRWNSGRVVIQEAIKLLKTKA